MKLLSTISLTISLLVFAYKEERVIVNGKLESICDMKIINITNGGLVKDILLSDKEELSKE